MSSCPFVIALFVLYLCNFKTDGSTVNITYVSSSVVPILKTSTRGSTTTAPCIEQVVSNEWRKEDFPNPQTDVARCGRNCQKSWICDPNRVITENSYVNKIDSTLTRIRRNGICGCLNCTGAGYKMSVALVNKIKFESWESVTTNKKKTRAFEFASYLRAQSWHPNGTCADDIVIFVSRGDRQVQTAVGPRATAVLSSGCVEYVYNQVRSDLTSGRFGKAVEEMTNLYEQAILTGSCGSISGALIAGIVGALLGGIAVVFTVIFLCKKGACRCDDCEHTHYSGHHYHGYHFDNRHRYGGRGGGGGGGGGGGFSSFGAGDGGGGGGGGF